MYDLFGFLKRFIITKLFLKIQNKLIIIFFYIYIGAGGVAAERNCLVIS